MNRRDAETGSRSRSPLSFNTFFRLCVRTSLSCIVAVVFGACSIPNLEQPECIEARDSIRRFYSLHFANDMKPSAEYLKIRKPFITGDLDFFISKQLNEDHDFFTLEKDYPKAFRVGECETASPGRTLFQVLLFWKDDTRSEQKGIEVEAVKENDEWLINRVYVN